MALRSKEAVSRIRSRMLCQYCRDFDYDQLIANPGYKHQPSWQALRSSAAQGCAVCNIALDEAHRRSRYDNEQQWRKAEQMEQIYCTFSYGHMYWNCGITQKSSVAVCVAVDDDLASLIETRLASDSVLTPESARLMRSWLEKCRKEHSTCPKYDTEHELPTRLLDVGSPADEPFLVTSNGRWGTWAALSHCWGRRLEVKTMKSNLQAHGEGIGVGLNDLPPTFQDAVRITRSLNIRYLWIDALCIIQDDKDDWEKEAVRMQYIYGNAAVTIAAEASSDNTIGILRSMQKWRKPQDKLVRAPCHSTRKQVRGELYFQSDHRKYNNHQSRGELSTRAWTMQEELLSPHILRFGSQQVLWNCSETTWSEWNPDRNEPDLWDFVGKTHDSLQRFPKADSDWQMPPSNKQRQQLLDFWYMEVINYYVGRGLTYMTDRLVAINGIAEEVRSRMNGIDYAAGIWYQEGYPQSADLHKGLAWNVPVGGAKANEEQYVAPSWSWAQLNVSSNPRFGQHNFVYHYKLLDTLVPLTDEISVVSHTISPASTSSIVTKKTSERLCLKMKSQCLEVCSCVPPRQFLDQRAPDPDRDRYYRIDRISEKHNANFNLIGLKAVKDRCSCPRIGKGKDHQRSLYVQIGRWEPSRADGWQVDVIVALILEEIGTALEPLYRRVGLAFMTVDPKWTEIEPWPVRWVSVI